MKDEQHICHVNPEGVDPSSEAGNNWISGHQRFALSSFFDMLDRNILRPELDLLRGRLFHFSIRGENPPFTTTRLLALTKEGEEENLCRGNLSEQVKSHRKNENHRDEVFGGMACREQSHAHFAASYFYACRGKQISRQVQDARKR